MRAEPPASGPDAMKPLFLTVLVAAGCLYVALCAFLYMAQRSLIYFPTPAPRDPPQDSLWLESGDVRVRVWRLHPGQSGAIVYFGGNAEDVSLNIPQFSRWFTHCTVYLVNYRGYSGSEGAPSEEALYADARRVFDFARDSHDSVIVMGRSLGSGVATHLASAREIDRLVLVTPFDSFESLAREYYPIFPTRWLLKDRYDSLSRAADIDVPVLVLVAAEDEIVPARSSRRLADAIDPGLVTLHSLEHVGHNSVEAAPAYGQLLRAFTSTPPASCSHSEPLARGNPPLGRSGISR